MQNRPQGGTDPEPVGKVSKNREEDTKREWERGGEGEINKTSTLKQKREIAEMQCRSLFFVPQ